MAKSLILNRVNSKNYSFNVPTTPANAETFASTFLEGEYAVYELGSTVGTETETDAWDVSVMVKNATSGEKAYLSLLLKTNKTEEDLFTALKGKTINGLVVDECFMMSMKKVTF